MSSDATMGRINTVHNFINGQMVRPMSGSYIDDFSPIDSVLIARIPRSNDQDVNFAVESAAKAFPTWRALSYQQRSRYLQRIADEIEKRFDLFVSLECQDTGKPLEMAKKVDIPRAIDNFRFFAGAISHASQSCHEMQGAINYTQQMPFGVCGLITPWNLPIYLLSWKIAPALAMGNTVVCKPSELTPLTANALSEVMSDVGIPAGVVNIVHGFGAEAGQPLVCHPSVSMISFTGGTKTGQIISTAAASSFKHLSLELGGKNASIVFADCDFERTVAGTVRAAFLNSGQICLAGSRIFVERSIYKRFEAAFIEEVEKITVGDPAKCWMGSVISAQHLKKIEAYVELARREGGVIASGGCRPNLSAPFSNGYFYQPTVITSLSVESRCATEEIFGPVCTLHPFSSEEEVIQWHNNVPYGLAGSVWTSNLRRAHTVSQQLETGMIWVNCWLRRDLRVPFGGIKASGIGKEGGFQSLDAFSQKKNICIALD